MGTWQTGPFDNDDAMEFFDEVEETPESEVLPKLRAQLAAIAERPGRVEVSEAAVAVAAAALIAAGSRAEPIGNPSVDDWLRAHRGAFGALGADDHALALRALDRVRDPGSEWLQLWSTTPRCEAVEARLETLRTALATANR